MALGVAPHARERQFGRVFAVLTRSLASTVPLNCACMVIQRFGIIIVQNEDFRFTRG